MKGHDGYEYSDHVVPVIYAKQKLTVSGAG